MDKKEIYDYLLENNREYRLTPSELVRISSICEKITSLHKVKIHSNISSELSSVIENDVELNSSYMRKTKKKLMDLVKLYKEG